MSMPRIHVMLDLQFIYIRHARDATRLAHEEIETAGIREL
jgi:hypothetical protein